MAVDVKSRAKRYEKLDFLGEGQVSLLGIRRFRSGDRRATSTFTGFLVGARGLAWLLVLFGRGCPDSAAAPVYTLEVSPERPSPF